MVPVIDLVVLTRDPRPLHPEVERGIREQHGVQLNVHRVVGSSSAADHCRWDAIARARNAGKSMGNSGWLMFLDDDVVLDPLCVRELFGELTRRPGYAALAADYLGEAESNQIARHVSMGATLFRRAVLSRINFRWRESKCECQCCCDDLRRLRWGIDYLETAQARHLLDKLPAPTAHARASRGSGQTLATTGSLGSVLGAFDRRHFDFFLHQFVASLRATGNVETVIPLAIGLRPSERRRLAQLPGVRPHFLVRNSQHAARRRLQGFKEIVEQLPLDANVAYWDVGDVIFQAPINPLWELVQRNPGKLLLVREPITHRESSFVAECIHTIADPELRRQTFDLLADRPILNSGFVAGTAKTLLNYWRTSANWYDSPVLRGSICWGDQMAFNIYCYSNPEAWQEIDEGWNYCLKDRSRSEVYLSENGQYVDSRGTPIQVVHGNAGTLKTVAVRRKRSAY